MFDTVSYIMGQKSGGGSGGGSSGLRLHATGESLDNLVLDKTALEIATAFEEHGNVWFLYESTSPFGVLDQLYVLFRGTASSSLDNGGIFTFYDGDESVRFVSNGPSDYPTTGGEN